MGVCLVKGHVGMTCSFCVACDPWFEPVCEIRFMRRINLTFGRRAIERPGHDSAFGGEAREAVPFFATAWEAKQSIGRRPGSAGDDQSSADEKEGGGGVEVQAAAFMTAPSMTTPALTNFHSATNSFLASATVSRLRAAFPVMVGRRWRYQRASAESG